MIGKSLRRGACHLGLLLPASLVDAAHQEPAALFGELAIMPWLVIKGAEPIERPV